MTTKQKTEMYAAIKKHGENLLKIFPNARISNPVALCKALHRLELKAQQAALDSCNTGDQAAHDRGEAIAIKAATILQSSGTMAIGVFFNGDPRGYALKLARGSARCDLDLSSCGQAVQIYKDWGGYGIVAPDFTPEVRR